MAPYCLIIWEFIKKKEGEKRPEKNFNSMEKDLTILWNNNKIVI